MSFTYQGLIFDLDMTLVDSRCTAHHRARFQWEKVNAKIHHIQPYAGIPELLQKAKQKHIPIGIVTSGSRPYCDQIVSNCRLGIRHSVCYRDAKPKPDPEGFLKVASVMGVSPNQIIAIGDRFEDVIGAKNAGMVAVAALWGCTAIPRVRSENPHYECATVIGLATLLGLG